MVIVASYKYDFSEVAMGPPPFVNGISPREGPPGTKITIRGENLGITATDLVSSDWLIV